MLAPANFFGGAVNFGIILLPRNHWKAKEQAGENDSEHGRSLRLGLIYFVFFKVQTAFKSVDWGSVSLYLVPRSRFDWSKKKDGTLHELSGTSWVATVFGLRS